MIAPMDGRQPRAAAGEVARAVEVLRLLADPTRLRILVLLRGAELRVGDLAAELDRPVPAVSQHLAKLRAAGLVVARLFQKTGREFANINGHGAGRAWRWNARGWQKTGFS